MLSTLTINDPLLQNSIVYAENILQSISQDSNSFYDIISRSFGTIYNPILAEAIRSQWASGDFSNLPSIQVLSSGMNGVAAYGSSTNTIYIDQNFLNSNQPDLLNTVLLEEIGHFLYDQSQGSSTGETGAIFSYLAQGIDLSDQQIAALQATDNTGTITLNGVEIPVDYAATVSFQSAVNYSTGTNPRSVTTGDFNADGKLDLAVANYSSSTVSILLGNGNGTFQSAANYSTGNGPFSVTTGDFNADGKLDLATANYTSSTVSILLGNGNGTFNSAVNYSTGTRPYSVTTGDFNADGKLDLAVVNKGSSTAFILLNSTTVSNILNFNNAVNYSTGTNPESVTTGDFNADGKLDLAVANNGSNTVSILLGNGNGTFNSAVNYSTGNGPVSVTTGDFNADGKLDLAVANFNSATASIAIARAIRTQDSRRIP